MTDWQLKTPVALIIFNRPETTARVFNAIRQARPPTLLIIADGPRQKWPGDSELCRQTREVVAKVDWPCELLFNFAEENMGCMRRVSSGLNWVFDIVEEAIVLEDDCLPHPTFFRFCQELLERYRHDQRIAQISGVNFQISQRFPSYSYYFSRYNHVWGWASWRRAWQSNDNEMTLWPEFRDCNWLYSFLGARKEAAYWEKLLTMVYEGEIDSWACRWTLSCWKENMLTILPSKNLVSNIGFGPDATHTNVESEFSNLPSHEMVFPLQHPTIILPDKKADAYTASRMFRERGVIARLVHLIPGCK